ncbi:DinB family protein [Actinomycetospora rhizophila]|uniref:DinB family protein n=1 Tax=Actinomycetospora rhizophila TaxID=1416876 RepID=A0ABV9ZLI4_9PSEU
MDAIDVLVDAFGRAQDDARRAVDGLTADELSWRADAEANPIAWLVWHLTRVQDDHVADLAGTEQVWTADGWARRFDLPLDDASIGYGHTSEQVASVRVEDPALLTGYLDAVHERTVAYLRTLSGDDLDEVIDDRWDPPVTRGVRLVSVVDDDIQHAGQAAYLGGLVRRRR